MALQPFRDEQLNYFKFASIALNEFPRALRQTFKSMWDNNFGHLPGFQPWDDSAAVRNMFLTTEGGTTKVPTHLSYDEWDCTALFKATIYARSFALPDSKGHHKTLSDLYVKPHKLPLGSFHVSVVSPGGNKAESFALAINQLRLLRNSLCHSSCSEIDKPTFDQYVQHSKDTFKALGVKTDPIDAIGSLTQSDFPTKEVRKLEKGIKEETRAYIKFLEGVSSDIDELRVLSTAIKGHVEGAVSKEDIAMMLEQKINDLKTVLAQAEQDLKPSLPRTCLPPMIPHFTGRQREVDEITGHVMSESTRIVSIWGSPGFGKTSVATAMGHRLHSEGLPVYFLSLREVQSKADLSSKVLSFFRRPATNDRQPERLSLDDELFQLLSEISDPFVLILDNADEVFESGAPKVKEEFINFLENILRRSGKVKIVITARESLEFMNVQIQGYQAVRIRPLDESSSQNLVNELLPSATPADCIRITKICGCVPLAMKLLCSSISEDDAQPSQVLDDLLQSLESNNVVEMLDNPDYPSNLRLKLLFDSSFQSLSTQEKQALVSLSVLPESFDLTVAASVLGLSQIPMTKKILYSLRRKSLLDSSSSKSGSFVMHQLLLSFAKQRGEREMKEIFLNAKSRLRAFYVSRFEKLNEQFLTGNSMSAFIEFYEDRQSYLESLIEGCSDSKTSDAVFRSLIKAELFLDSLFWCEGENIDKIYDSAIAAAKNDGKNEFYRQLIVSLALTEVPSGVRGRTMQLLSEATNNEVSCSSVSDGDKGKHLCYSGICQLVIGKTEHGVQCLEEALSLMNGSYEQRILRIIVFQILATYYRFKKNSSRTSHFYTMAIDECRTVGDTQLVVVPAVENTGKEIGEEMAQRKPEKFLNLPLTLEILCLVNEATKNLREPDTKGSVSYAVLNIVKEIEKPLLQSSLGLFNFQHNVNRIVQSVLGGLEEAANLSSARISYHEKAIEQCESGKENSPHLDQKCATTAVLHQEALAKSYSDYAYIQCKLRNYSEALRAEQRALDIKRKLFGEKHSSTADSYYSLGDIHHALGDLTSAIQSTQRALDIRRKSFGEDARTANCYLSLAVTQHEKGDFASALQSHQRALDIRKSLFGEEHVSTAYCYHLLGLTHYENREFISALQLHQHALGITRKLFGEEHPSTADSYYSLGVTQYTLGDLSSAIQSAQRALHIRRKLFGDEHSSTADSYYALGVTQHAQGDVSSAIQSTQRALHIRRKLFGEEHSNTANSYHSLGVTQHKQGDFTIAIQSIQRALDIRRKLFGERHANTAESYHSLGITQHALGDFASAIQSAQRALDIRRKLFGEEHSSTADSYHSLGDIQHEQGDFASSIQSTQCALDVRRKLFGEEHSNTANSYHSLGVTQNTLEDYTSAIQSIQRALDIRRKMLGEEHSSTADSYRELGVTQHELGGFMSAIQSKERALHIKRKLFGEEHSSTADSYRELGVTQYALGDFAAAIQSIQRSVDIRSKQFGEKHSSTADSYHLLGITQHALGDFTLAIQSAQRALDIRRELFGEEHPSTADSYQLLGVTQHALGEFTLAIQPTQRALDIRRELFGEQHPSTADSYHSLGVTQHALGDFTLAIQSTQRALDIRRELFGEEHSSTADSYHTLGVTQHAQDDLTSAS